MFFGNNKTNQDQKPFLRDWLSKKNKRTIEAVLNTEYVVEEIVKLEKGLLLVCPDFVVWVWKSNVAYENLVIYLDNSSQLDSTTNGIVVKVLSTSDWEITSNEAVEVFCRKTYTKNNTTKYNLMFVES